MQPSWRTTPYGFIELVVPRLKANIQRANSRSIALLRRERWALAGDVLRKPKLVAAGRSIVCDAA